MDTVQLTAIKQSPILLHTIPEYFVTCSS